VQIRALERAMVLLSLDNLLTYPWIKERVLAGKLTINGWYFDFASGALEVFNPNTHTFEPVSWEEGSEPKLPSA
jgi:carbonic anhydrase